MDTRYGALTYTVYEGSTNCKTKDITNFGLGAGVAPDIIDGLAVDSDGNLKPMFLSVDNFFNSFQLIDQCSLRNILIKGTLRADRLKEVPISSTKEVLKKDRGYFEVVHTSNQGKQGGLNKKEIQLNLCNILSILICNELYLFVQ